MATKKLKVGVICGGPSLERGISLNSARSLLDHLESDTIDIIPFYLDHKKRPYAISTAQLYSNTPSDFDFKLHQLSKPLDTASFVKALKKTDIIFPCIHGPYGEDGELQRFLESHNIPYIGASSESCKLLFDKYTANCYIRDRQFYTKPSEVLKIYHDDHKDIIDAFFKRHAITRAIVKPACGGSSIYVFSVGSPEEALERTQFIFSKRHDTRVVIEPHVEGIEFTTIIVENDYGLPVSIIPTEIEADYSKHQIFDFRKKYLPTRAVTHHCPPRFDDSTIETIQIQAEQLFSLFKMNDFARFDGWVLPDGNIWFSDFNPISGMEQNSFLFQQCSKIGMSHGDIFRHIVRNACRRYDIPFPESPPQAEDTRKPVHVLFGGSTSERQVSLMSGTNVWLKLLKSDTYKPIPYLLSPTGTVWKTPYPFALNHTVEEVVHGCEYAKGNAERLRRFVEKVRLKLGPNCTYSVNYYELPEQHTLDSFFDQASFVFLGLHGGVGENGTLQKQLEKRGLPFNGPSAQTCRLCMDKHETAKLIHKANLPGIKANPQVVLECDELFNMDQKSMEQVWENGQHLLGSRHIIIKPASEGCSSGIVKLSKSSEFVTYIRLIKEGHLTIPSGTFSNQNTPIELSPNTPTRLLLEPFIETDIIRVKNNTLKHYSRSGYIEITAGVVEKKGNVHVLNPSITVAEGAVLSVEEKFQGGTGVNITPPPESIVHSSVLKKAKAHLKQVAILLGITGYSRIDAFLDIRTGDILVIESNSLPGLTPSTVIYHQGLAEKPSLFPRPFIETLISNKGY